MKIGFFITARLKSTRLKKKIILDLNGKTVIERVIDRCKKTSGVDGVVLCTSTNNQDEALLEYAAKEKINSFRGSEDDVLQRLLDAAKLFQYDAFVSITADNPLFSIDTSQVLIKQYKLSPFDFGFTKGLPIGIGTYLLNTKALDVAICMKKQADTEIWGPFVNRPDFFKIFNLLVKNSPFNESTRLTLDFPEDYELIKKLHESNKFDLYSTKELLNFLLNNSAFLEINKERAQFYPSEQELNNIKNCFDKNVNIGVNHAIQIDKELQPGLIDMDFEI
jgi:spore coat polysaccharide biosynthesis protein SpsF